MGSSGMVCRCAATTITQQSAKQLRTHPLRFNPLRFNPLRFDPLGFNPQRIASLFAALLLFLCITPFELFAQANNDTPSADYFQNNNAPVSPATFANGARSTPEIDQQVSTAGWQTPVDANGAYQDRQVVAASTASPPRTLQPMQLESNAGELQAASASSTDGDAPLALRPPSQRNANGLTSGNGTERPANMFGNFVSVISSLLLVLATFLAFVWIMRRTKPKEANALPSNVLQVLGSSRLGVRNSLYLLRVGQKLVLVSSGTGDVQTITEITDPIEVAQLCGQCEQSTSNSITQSFRQVLKNVTDGTAVRMQAPKKKSGPNPSARSKDDDEISPAIALLAREQRG